MGLRLGGVWKSVAFSDVTPIYESGSEIVDSNTALAFGTWIYPSLGHGERHLYDWGQQDFIYLLALIS